MTIESFLRKNSISSLSRIPPVTRPDGTVLVPESFNVVLEGRWRPDQYGQGPSIEAALADAQSRKEAA